MRSRYAFAEVLLLCLLLFCVMVSASNGETPQDEKMEIPIDFPFCGEEKEHGLALAALEEGQNTYELLHYDGDGKVIQKIFCGRLTEPVTFSYDGLAYMSRHDLEIFSDGGDRGLLLIWQDGMFSRKPIDIPRYEECRGSAMLTLAEDEEVFQKDLYHLNGKSRTVEKVRSYIFWKDTTKLKIWDETENQYIFIGRPRLDANGDPVNKKYFDSLLWDGRPPSLGYGETNTIHTWVGEEPEPQEEETVAYNGYEHVRNYLKDYPSWHTEEYESREALLTDFGFGDSEPVYQYFDGSGKLKLELYMDEVREQACGLVYTDQAFTLCWVPEVEWNGGDPYTFRSVYGTTGEERENVKDYEEHIEYNAFGKPELFVSRGRVEGWLMEDEMQDILRIEFAYREDGTLYYREYYHSHQVFMTTLRHMAGYYDVHERVSFEEGFFTHGKLEYYYIYEDRDGRIADKPAYILEIDYNMGTLFPRMIKCR